MGRAGMEMAVVLDQMAVQLLDTVSSLQVLARQNIPSSEKKLLSDGLADTPSRRQPHLVNLRLD
jgi:hypothetical protein